MGLLKEITIFLIVFIAGSLIVSFIISSGTISSFNNSVKNIFSSNTTNNTKMINTIYIVNTIKLIPSEMEEYGFWKQLYKSCAEIEVIGNSNNVDNLKKISCQEACGKRDMNYYSYTCEKDLFICNCVK